MEDDLNYEEEEDDDEDEEEEVEEDENINKQPVVAQEYQPD
jgi:hypothetical protein